MKGNPVWRAVMALILALTGSLAYLARPAPTLSAGTAAGAATGSVSVAGGVPGTMAAPDTSKAASLSTATPIKHLVVIFSENQSFDHYFGTYPKAANAPGEPAFTASADTPTVNGLSGSLRTGNPNGVNPFRLSRAQAYTCDMNHGYMPEQQAEDSGAMDKFVQYTDAHGKPGNARQYCPNGAVMGYYDGNTVTALWNYAQDFAMSDNFFGTTFGPSTPGALNLTSADIAGAVCGPTGNVYNTPGPCSASAPPTASGTGAGTVIADPDPYYDDCSSGGTADKSKTAALNTRNIGDLLTAAGATWGWFQGGFRDCKARHPVIAVDRLLGIDPATDTTTRSTDYSPHHEPFQYFASTSNPHHLPPTGTAMVGQTDQANHQYDLTDLWPAADSGNLPAVSFLKAASYQDAHPANSDPLDEQEFVANTVNHLMSLPSWSSTAVIIAYDDSDGWYDHVRGPIVNHSSTSLDVGCGATTDGPPARCGYGPRLPFILISPYARRNVVDHTLIDQSSITRFIEDNWLGGKRLSATSFDNKAGPITGMFDFGAPRTAASGRLFLNPITGAPAFAPGTAGFLVTFSSAQPGQGMVYFGPSCSALVMVGTSDQTAGTTTHTVLVTGNDLPGTVGNIGITPGATYYFEVVTASPGGQEVDNNGGSCYSVTIPST
ncbi:MAG: alkaline phosphatase family protein [Chloroflexi bacterium]|nr:alkaline phosphatase family protein [Chloroflexota bacterium]